MKAPFFKPGTITMQWAFSSKSWGIPLSGASITSENTVAASFSRSMSFSSAAASVFITNGEMAVIEMTAVVAKKDRNLGIGNLLFALKQLRYHECQRPQLKQ